MTAKLYGAKKSVGVDKYVLLAAAVPAWEQLTGAELVDLAKMDMLVWNGDSPWSSSQLGLLWMDRFRTIWNPDTRYASNLLGFLPMSLDFAAWCRCHVSVTLPLRHHSKTACWVGGKNCHEQLAASHNPY